MDVKQGPLVDKKGGTKIELVVISGEPEENALSRELKNELYVGEKIHIFESQSMANVPEIKQEIIECTVPKSEHLNLPTKNDNDWVRENVQVCPISIIKKEVLDDTSDVREVNAKDMFVDISDNRGVNEYIQPKVENELLTTNCDLPTLKNESIEHLDYFVKPCSSNQTRRKGILKKLQNTQIDVFRKKRRTMATVCQKNSPYLKSRISHINGYFRKNSIFCTFCGKFFIKKFEFLFHCFIHSVRNKKKKVTEIVKEETKNKTDYMEPDVMKVKRSRGLTLEKALQIAYDEDENQIANIYIEPPEGGVLTDEDSGEEDGGGFADNLSRNQLRGTSELLIFDNQASSQETLNESQFLKEIKDQDIEWATGDFEYVPKYFPYPDQTNYTKFKMLTSLEMFELFIDDEVIHLLVEESNKYAQFKKSLNPHITKDEMKCFVAILILSGYNELPERKHYWDSEGDMGNDLIRNAMRRDRFITISRYLHCADNNNLNPTDKLSKLRPFIDILRKKIVKYFVPEKGINYNESMVNYFGKHPCNQLIKGKLIRFGYKVYCLNSESGYLINFMVYQGKNSNVKPMYNDIFGTCTAPFWTLLNELPDDKRILRYSFYFENSFTSFDLLCYLRELGYEAAGAIKDSRLPKTCPLPSKAEMKKKSRGEYESIIDKTNGIIVVKWADNNVASLASNTFGVKPLSLVKRYSKQGKKVIQINRPYVISKYNSSMGGTDLMDENIARCRIGLREKKWWWCLFTWLLDISIQNSWILFKNAGNKVTQLQFRREIVKAYLTKYKNPPRGAGRPSTSISSRSSSRVSDNIRFDNIGHLLTTTIDKKRKRCAGEECKSIVRTICSKCNIGLCVDCNIKFHCKF